MAAVMNNGTLLHPIDQMHPFFRPAQTINKREPLAEKHEQQKQQPSGSFEEESALVSCPEPIRGNDGLFVKVATGTESAPLDTSSHTNLEQERDGLEVDPNQDRRKRRKVTPTNPSQIESQIPTVNEANSNDAAQTQPMVHIDPQYPSSLQPQTICSPENTDVVMTTPNRRRSLRVDPIKERASPKTKSTTISPEDRVPSRSVTQKSPRPKKMLKLDANGRFAKSPSKQTDSNSSTSTSTASRSKNLGVKKGQLVPSLHVVLSYGVDVSQREATAKQIDNILTGQHRIPLRQQTQHTTKSEDAKKLAKFTHPFFRTKALSRCGSNSSISTLLGSTVQESEGHPNTADKAPKPWNEITFSTSKTPHAKDIITLNPLWPPKELQRVSPPSNSAVTIVSYPRASTHPKRKEGSSQISPEEDVLKIFTNDLRTQLQSPVTLRLPTKYNLSGYELCSFLESSGTENESILGSKHPATQSMRNRAVTHQSAFDRGMPAGPMSWNTEYAPRTYEDVLQPQAEALFDWLKRLQVHQVRSGAQVAGIYGRSKPPPKKRRMKNKSSGLDDFIVSSDDEGTTGRASVKNAILICGPHGCGKTASVYAVAQQLGFEVFEIHSGMRRSAKDIFDKVGDMAQNHQVQRSKAMSRSSSAAPEELDLQAIEQDVADGKQQTMASFMAGVKRKPKMQQPIAASGSESKDRTQKQSLILFEEVDNLFDEDKSFWNGVQSLIQQSRRPVILTCNSTENIPFDELELHATLFYEHQPIDIAVDYILYLAAAEGHLLDRKALRTLYQSKSYDLRATITELSLWCQIGIGSTLGGLDWLPQSGQSSAKDLLGNKRRTISNNTFTEGLDLIAGMSTVTEESLKYLQECLDLSALDWLVKERAQISETDVQFQTNRISSLDDALAMADAMSCIDVFHDSLGPLVCTAAQYLLPEPACSVSISNVLSQLLKPRSEHITTREIADAFEPIMEDIRTFPPTVGRTAPALDSANTSVATEVAPYVRSIVEFDMRLEQYREQLGGGSQGKGGRTTRAARAALEGGDKASTRREKWFPGDLDFSAVLKTGNSWPQHIDLVDFGSEWTSVPSTQSPLAEEMQVQ